MPPDRHQARVGKLCQDATVEPVLVVELDDSSHDRADRKERDRFVDEACEDAGLPVLHVKFSWDGYPLGRLRSQVEELTGVASKPAESGGDERRENAALIRPSWKLGRGSGG